ncbi:MAG: imidazole glycerol phosphate synthase subunit HisF [Fusobacteriaceae bacterium]|jgi:cyclase|nr:imidazole glycerol phosphate synthase subunit HisF [Fusobacteriaceae bacterium]
MLGKRIIPCLDIKDGRVVKGVNFVGLIDAGDPVEVAKIYNNSLADEIVFLDITASSDNREILIDVIRRAAKEVFIPLTVGGGIRNIDNIREVLNAGADKISINSAAVNDPNLIKKSSLRFGSQCIVVAIDAKWNDNFYEVYINGGRTPTGINALNWAKEAEKLGAGEILLTSMDTDGTKNGYEIKLNKLISSSVNIPVIASGGAGKMEDFRDVFKDGLADAALAASLFHFKELEIKDLKDYLVSEGITVRQS